MHTEGSPNTNSLRCPFPATISKKGAISYFIDRRSYNTVLERLLHRGPVSSADRNVDGRIKQRDDENNASR